MEDPVCLDERPAPLSQAQFWSMSLFYRTSVALSRNKFRTMNFTDQRRVQERAFV